MTDSQVLDAFIPFGEIVEVQLPKSTAQETTDSHRGFAYVEFEQSADAEEAIDNMNQSEFFGRILKVSQAKAPKSADEGLGSKKAIWEQASSNALEPPPVQAADVFTGGLAGRKCQRSDWRLAGGTGPAD